MCEHHHEHEEENSKLKLVKIGLSFLIFLIAILSNIQGWGRFSLYLVAYIIAGGDIIVKAIKNIIKGEIFDENFLMSIATIGAFSIKEYPEAVMVMVLYQIGEYFQDKAVDKSKKSISELMDIRPDYTNVEENGQLTKKSPKEINIGDIIVVNPGEKVPLDGIIIVTSPQDLVSLIVTKAIKMANMMNIPILGIVENYSYIVCPDCNNKIELFGKSKINELASENNIKNVIKLPLDPSLTTLCDEGKIEDADVHYFDDLIKNVIFKK